MTSPQGQVSGETVAAVSLIAVEAAFAIAVLAAYKAWLGKVRAAMFAVLPINPAAIWSLIPDWERSVNTLMTDLARIAEMGWNAARGELDGLATEFDITNPVLQDQLRRTRNFMVDTADEVYVMVIRALDANAGDPMAQEAAVRNILDVTGTVNWPFRSRLVAQVEVGRAFEFGHLAAGLSASFPVIKTWGSHDDTATRAAHANADGQARPMGQPFIVGGEALMAPLDPAGSAWNVCGCRCRMRLRRR